MKNVWTYKKLTDVCDIQYGYPFDSAGFSASADDGMPLIRIRDVKDGCTSTYFKGDYPEEYIVHKGDYLVGMDGEFNIAPWKSEDALLNQRVCKVASKSEEVSIGFLYRFLVKELKKIEDETPFVTVKHLSAKRLNQVYLNIPPLSEQQHIVSELDLLQSIIDKQQSQLKELDNLAQSIFYDMFGINDFKRTTLESVYKFIDYRGATPNKISSGVPLITAKNVRRGYIDYSIDEYISEDEYNRRQSRGISHKGDILFTTEAPLGYAAIADLEKYSAGQRLITLQLFESSQLLLNNIYTLYFILSNSFQQTLQELSTGCTVKGIKASKLKLCTIPLPPLSLQQSFATKIESIEKQKSSISQSIAETQKLFDYTMDKYFG